MKYLSGFLRFTILWILMFGETSQAQSERQNHNFCENKFKAASESLRYAQLKYGTVYSGGVHFSKLDNVGHTIDLYRELSGLKPAYGNNFGFNYKLGLNFHSFVTQDSDPLEAQIKIALGTMTTDRVTQMVNLEATARALDIATSAHPAIDWWLRVDDFEQGDIWPEDAKFYYRRDDNSKTSPLQLTTAKLAKSHPELDWLQSALAISTVTYPWEIKAGDTPSPELANVMDHISERALNAKNPLPWIALLELNLAYDHAVSDGLRDKLGDMVKRVGSCGASPAEYAAVLANRIPLPANRLYEWASVRQYRYQMKKYLVLKDRRFDAAFYEYAMNLSGELNIAANKFGAVLLAASTPEQLNEALDGSRSNRHLNILEHLKTEYLRPHLPGTAFTREFSLGNFETARRILNQALRENAKLSSEFKDIIEADIPEPLRLALIILRQKCLSHNLSDFCDMERYRGHIHRDIGALKPPATFLLNSLYCQGEPMVGYRGYGKLVAAASERNARRGLHSGGVNARGYRNQRCIIPRISEVLGDYTPGPPGPGLAALFDSAEIQEFLGEKRLSRSLSLVAIQAAKNKSQPKETEPFIAEALHRVVWLNRHEDGGEIDGHPAGRRAFKLLHAGFPENEWTEKTPYWWPPRRRH